MKLEGKVAIVTGSGAGIGRGIALELAKNGAKVVVNVSRSIDNAEEVVGLIKDMGGEAFYVQADVTNPEDVDRLVGEAINRFGRVDILVNNAGMSERYPKLLEEMEDDEWFRMVNLNLNSLFLVTKRVIPEFRKQDGGKIINIGSLASFEAGSGFGYVTTKHGVLGFTKELANKYGKDNINANAICPGAVESKMTEGMFDEGGPYRALLEATPARRVANPEEIGRLAVYLVSEDSSFINGTSVVIDGGWLVK